MTFFNYVIMTILKTIVAHVAQLAKLELNEDELETFTKQLGDVVRYVEILNEVDTERVQPTHQITGLTNVLREDIAVDYPEADRKKLLGGVPRLISAYVVVPNLINLSI